MKKADTIWNTGLDLMDDDGEVREVTDEDFAKMTPFSHLPKEEREFLLQVNDATLRPDPGTVEEVRLKLSRPVLERFRASGSGWESRVDEALLQWMEEHKLFDS